MDAVLDIVLSVDEVCLVGWVLEKSRILLLNTKTLGCTVNTILDHVKFNQIDQYLSYTALAHMHGPYKNTDHHQSIAQPSHTNILLVST